MGPTQLQAVWRTARDWLFEAALPLWCEAGLDPAGGFHDQIGDDRRPVNAPKRLRVQGRQMFVFAEAGRMGWTGPWREAVEHGLTFLKSNAPEEGDLYPSTYEAGQARGLTLYDQAFVLLGLAHASRVLDAPELDARAQSHLSAIRRRLGRSDGGFDEVEAGEAPLQSNPHMHLYEACLAWRPHSAAPVWRETAEIVRRLAHDVFIDPTSGRIGEYFGDDRRPAPGPPGRLAEPGHQFEWASLMMIDGRQDDAVAERLALTASRTGVDRARNVAFFSQDLGGVAIDRSARLWAQTERLRASLILRGRSADPGYWTSEALKAFEGLQPYLATPGRGLWRDRMDEAGGLDGDPAKASSLYHVMGAYAALWDAAEGRL